jgi:hypothetical protein
MDESLRVRFTVRFPKLGIRLLKIVFGDDEVDEMILNVGSDISTDM